MLSFFMRSIIRRFPIVIQHDVRRWHSVSVMKKFSFPVDPHPELFPDRDLSHPTMSEVRYGLLRYVDRELGCLYHCTTKTWTTVNRFSMKYNSLTWYEFSSWYRFKEKSRWCSHARLHKRRIHCSYRLYMPVFYLLLNESRPG